eukprot:3413028-Amphidinium_carterae.1
MKILHVNSEPGQYPCLCESVQLKIAGTMRPIHGASCQWQPPPGLITLLGIAFRHVNQGEVVGESVKHSLGNHRLPAASGPMCGLKLVSRQATETTAPRQR